MSIRTDKLLISSDFYSIQGEGISSGIPSYFVRLSQCNLHSIGVKPGRREPRIMTPTGTDKKISKVKPGDLILAYDETSKKLTTTEVKASYKYKIDSHLEIKIENTPTLYVSETHPFLTSDGWKLAKDLKLGDEILHFTKKDKMSFKMKHFNPMKSSQVVQKSTSTTNYTEVGKKVSKTRIHKFKTGELKPSLHVLREEDPDRYEKFIKSQSTRMKKNNPMFDPEVIRRSKGAHSRNRKYKGYHSKTEYEFHTLCQEVGIDLRYVGNYDMPIHVKQENGVEKYIYPDFVMDGTNKVYEVFWTAPEDKPHFTTKNLKYISEREQLYRNAGYQPVFVDFTQLNKQEIGDMLTSDLQVHNGLKVEKVKRIQASKYKSQYKPLQCYDLSCYPHQNYIVEGVVSHNCGISKMMMRDIRKAGTDGLEDGEVFTGDLEAEGKATWTCDSTSQWAIRGENQDFQYLFDRWEEQNILKLIANGTIHIIWTGGEPTIPNHQQAIVNFTTYAIRKGYFPGFIVKQVKRNKKGEESEVQEFPDKGGLYAEPSAFYEIETNGTFYIEDSLFNLIDQINCSPKLSNSGMTEKQRIVPEAINRIKQHSNYQFKFVVSTEEDIKEMYRDFVEPFNIPNDKIVCMPGLDDQADFHERTNFILEMAKKYKFRGLTRLHISGWNQTLNV